jgi:hypothetical protein
MSWTRLDDGWTDRPIFEQLPYDVRWHYLALVQFCSRTSRYDGIVRAADARRCSDVPDPAAATTALVNAGLLVAYEDGFRLPLIDEHTPPPHLRDETRKAGQKARKRRERLHKSGNHSDCLAEHCSYVTGDVTRDTGTGQDRTGRDRKSSAEEDVLRDDEPCDWCGGPSAQCDCLGRKAQRRVPAA